MGSLLINVIGTSNRSQHNILPLIACHDGVPGEMNDSRFCGDLLSTLVSSYEESFNTQERKKILRRISDEIYRLKLYIPLSVAGEYIHAWRGSISGIYRDELGVWDLSQGNRIKRPMISIT